MEEKFLKAIEDNYDHDSFFIDKQEITNQCTRINIEEKIKLLGDLLQNTKHTAYVTCSDVADKISELTNELKQL